MTKFNANILGTPVTLSLVTKCPKWIKEAIDKAGTTFQNLQVWGKAGSKKSHVILFYDGSVIIKGKITANTYS